jgi:lysophospholipase L1-like esterase
VALLVPSVASAQVDFPQSGNYAALGDSVAAGQGAIPATRGYPYLLYDQGVFGQKQEIGFENLAVRGGRSWDLRNHQVPQLLCSGSRPTVITITAGAADAFRGDLNPAAIAQRVVEAVALLLHNGTPLVPVPVLDPVTGLPCPPITNVTILVSNYYRIPHPDPLIDAQLDALIRGFDQALSLLLPLVPVPPGSKVAKVDLYTPSLGREGLVLIERSGGFTGPLDFDPHPTNLGHSFIAQQFKEAWLALQ